MPCKWELENCKNIGDKCVLCSSEGYYYTPIKAKTYKRNKSTKTSKRKGSLFEKRNHESNKEILEARSEMTPNSGAGSIKGDEQISGIISVMEELKSQNRQLARGNKSFSVQKSWLEKLEKEAKDAEAEFYYLKFCFGEHENKAYVIVDSDIVMSMIKTMVEDRKTANRFKKEIELTEKRRRAVEAKNIALEAELEYLKTSLKLMEEEQ